MRSTLLASLFTLALTACTASPSQTRSQGRTPVLVELFTSEGCSSCPPADALLARLLHDQPIDSAQVIALGEHVDYWDNLGWHDRFSSPQFTSRQSQYSARFRLDSVYTPQMVVDGAAQFVGNDQAQARSSIAQAARTPKLPLTLLPLKRDGRILSGGVASPAVSSDPSQNPGPNNSSLLGSNPDAELYAALIDPADTTDVRNGENGGRTLHHVAVVRVLARLGTVQDLAGGHVAFTLKAPDSSDPSTMQLIVFAQQPNAGPILGIATAAK
jgi:hypothetical protein